MYLFHPAPSSRFGWCLEHPWPAVGRGGVGTVGVCPGVGGGHRGYHRLHHPPQIRGRGDGGHSGDEGSTGDTGEVCEILLLKEQK